MALTVEGLSCGYGNTCVVEQASFALDQGRVIAVLGPNGVGKTTLFKAVLGFIPARKGSIVVDDSPITSLSRSQIAQRIAYVPQQQTLPFSYTVEDVVLMGRAPYLRLLQQPGPEDYAAVKHALALMGIDHLAKKACSEISGGELQMAFVARALAQQPRYLIMDEPTASLDFGNQMHVLERIMSLAEQGIGVLLTTHDPTQAFTLKSDVLLMQRESRQQYGYYRDVLTEDALRRTYGVDVLVRSVPHEGRSVECCMALPKNRRAK